MKIIIHIWTYLAQFLEWEMFQTKVLEKIKTFFFFFEKKSCRSWYNVETYCRAGWAIDDNVAHAHCMLNT